MMAQTRESKVKHQTAAPGTTGWTAFWNGRFVPDTDVSISPWDRGFMMGDAAFEATRTYRHQLFHLDWHMDRLFNSLEYLRLDPRLSRPDLEQITLDLLDRNRQRLLPHEDVVVTHRITRGEFGGSFAAPPEPPPTLLFWCRPLAFARFARFYREGVTVDVPDIRVPTTGGVDPRAKTHSRLLLTLGHVQIGHLRPEAVPLLLDADGYATESAAASILYFIGGTLVSPPDHVALDGITRRALLEIAPQINVPVARRPVHRSELSEASEAILTGTSFGLLPVRRLDGRDLAPVPGPLTRALTAAFSAHVGLDIIAQSQGRLAP